MSLSGVTYEAIADRDEVIDALRASLDSAEAYVEDLEMRLDRAVYDFKHAEAEYLRLREAATAVVSSQELITREDGHLYGLVKAGLLYLLLKELENGNN